MGEVGGRLILTHSSDSSFLGGLDKFPRPPTAQKNLIGDLKLYELLFILRFSLRYGTGKVKKLFKNQPTEYWHIMEAGLVENIGVHRNEESGRGIIFIFWYFI